MSEQIPPRPGFPHPNSDSGYPERTNSGGFVVVDDSEDQIRQPVEHEEPEGRETSRNRALTGSESAAEASVGQHQGIFQLEEERSTQTERRWRQWRSNSLSEGKIMALDRLQNRLRVILAVNEDLEHPETPRQIGVHRNLRDAQTEPREDNRHSVHSFKSASDAAPTNGKISETNGSRTEEKSAPETRVLRSLERSSSLPRIIGESCLSRTRRDSCQSGLKLSRLSALGRDEQRKQLPTRDRAPAKPLRNRDFRREENEGADRIARDYFEGREYPRSRSLSSGNSPGNHHRCQNEYYQNLCELCHFPVPVFQPLTIELRGSYYHKRCLVDLFFTKEELYAALRARCRAHLRTRDARAERSPAWRRIFGKISKLLKGN